MYYLLGICICLCAWFNDWVSAVKNIYSPVCAWKWSVERRKKNMSGVMAVPFINLFFKNSFAYENCVKHCV